MFSPLFPEATTLEISNDTVSTGKCSWNNVKELKAGAKNEAHNIITINYMVISTYDYVIESYKL